MFEKLGDGAGRLAALAAVIRTDRYNAGLGTATGAAGTDQGPVRLALVLGPYFSTLGVGAARGRVFAADDDRPRAHPVALVSDSYWATRFARTPDILGRTITLGDITYDVVGVAPAAFTGDWVGRPADVWIPIVWQPRVMVEIPLGLPNSGVTVIGRLASGVSMAQAEGA